jgi:ketosteroid isomerase-like protein
MAASADVVRRYFEAFEHDDLDHAGEFWHPDIEWRAMEGSADDVGVMRGQLAMRRYCEDWVDTFDQLRAEVEEVLFEEGERVVVAVRNSGRGRASGVVTGGRYYVTATVADGLILRGREYATPEEALKG